MRSINEAQAAHYSEAFCIIWSTLRDLGNSFSSRRQFEPIKARFGSTITSIHSCIRSISFSTFLDLIRRPSTFLFVRIPQFLPQPMFQPSVDFFDVSQPSSSWLDLRWLSAIFRYTWSARLLLRASSTFSESFLNLIRFRPTSLDISRPFNSPASRDLRDWTESHWKKSQWRIRRCFSVACHRNCSGRWADYHYHPCRKSK
jgi:hypothetical protein